MWRKYKEIMKELLYEGWRMWRNYSPHIWTVGFGKILSSSHWVGGGSERKNMKHVNAKSLNTITPASLLGFSPLSQLLTSFLPNTANPLHHHTSTNTFSTNSPINSTPPPYVSLMAQNSTKYPATPSSQAPLVIVTGIATQLPSLPPSFKQSIIAYSTSSPQFHPLALTHSWSYPTHSPPSFQSVNLLSPTHSFHTFIYSFKHAKPLPSVWSPSHTGITGNKQIDQAA